MYYGYEGKEDKEIIKYYIKESDKIIIKFLDDSKYEIPYTVENEEKLLKEMLEQAIERNDKLSISDLETKRKDTAGLLFRVAVSTLACPFIYLVTDSEFLHSFFNVLGSIAGIGTLISGSGYLYYNNKFKEMKKYNIYLEIKSKLENSVDPNIFYNVTERKLNINTLDSFKLKELKQLKENILKSERFSKYFSEETDNITLTKKINK